MEYEQALRITFSFTLLCLYQRNASRRKLMTFKTLIAAAAIAVTTAFGAIATTTTTAQAGEVTFGFQIGSGPYNNRSNQGWNNGWSQRPVAIKRYRCSPQHALRKARRMGVHRARIVRMNRHRIKVVGRSRGQRVAVKFVRNRHCSVLRTR